MNRSHLIEKISNRFSSLTRHDAKQSVALILEAMSGSLGRGDRIEIRGFGSFDIIHHKPRTGRNPKTGQSVQVAAKDVPHFKVAKELRSRVQSGQGSDAK